MSRLAGALVAWDQWFYRLGIAPGTREIIRRDGPAWLIGRTGTRGRLLLTDAALYFRSASSVVVRAPQVDLRLDLAEIDEVSPRDGIEWRAALPGLSSFEVGAHGATYVFQTAHSDAWIASIKADRQRSG